MDKVFSDPDIKKQFIQDVSQASEELKRLKTIQKSNEDAMNQREIS